jgi:hypothetical protein
VWVWPCSPACVPACLPACLLHLPALYLGLLLGLFAAPAATSKLMGQLSALQLCLPSHAPPNQCLPDYHCFCRCPPCPAGMKLVREATEAAETKKEKDKEAGGC